MIRARAVVVLAIGALVTAGSCTSLPEIKHAWHAFPAKEAFVGEPARAYSKIGVVRERVDFPTLDSNHEEKNLCRNYYNQAVKGLVRRAKERGADAVIDIKSVVFYEGGQSEMFASPECSDEGDTGQVLVQGVAVKWKAEESKAAPAATPSPAAVSSPLGAPMPVPSENPKAAGKPDETVDPSGVVGTPARKLEGRKRALPRIPRPNDPVVQ